MVDTLITQLHFHKDLLSFTHQMMYADEPFHGGTHGHVGLVVRIVVVSFALTSQDVKLVELLFGWRVHDDVAYRSSENRGDDGDEDYATFHVVTAPHHLSR